MDGSQPQGFEDRWADRRRDWVATKPVLSPAGFSKAQLARIAGGAPEVFVRPTGRPKTLAALKDHLRYIGRDGELELEGRAGERFAGREDLDELASSWSFAARRDTARRAQTPQALSIVFALPPGQDPQLVRQASHAFIAKQFPAHPYVLVLHTDRPHPHVHAAIRWLGDDGGHVPSHRDAALSWREGFAATVRSLGHEVEASPRWARGVIEPGDPFAVRKLRERFRAGEGELPRRDLRQLLEAKEAAGRGEAQATPREIGLARRQLAVRQAYLALSQELRRSDGSSDHTLADRIDRFVAKMPPPVTRRMDLVRGLLALRREPEARQARERQR